MKRAAFAVTLLLTPVFVLAGRIPGLSDVTEIIRGVPAEARIDYARRHGGFAPLSAAYFARLYGEPLPLAAGSAGPRSGERLSGRATDREVTTGAVSDDFERAIVINRVPFEGGGDTRGATRQEGEPSSCSRVGGTVWYRYTPRVTTDVVVSTSGSDYPLTVGVFRGTSLGLLEEERCKTAAQGSTTTSFTGRSGQTYFFQIAGPVGGRLQFLLDPLGPLTLVSTGPTDPHTHFSDAPALSANGRYVAFASYDPMTPRAHEACDQVEQAGSAALERASQSSLCSQVYLRDTKAKTTRLVSTTTHGAGGNANSGRPSISSDGRFVAFESRASDLVPGDTNGISDIFVRDMLLGRTERVSMTESGEQAQPRATPELEALPPPTAPRNWMNNKTPVISGDGRVVIFETQSSNLSGDERPCRAGCGMVVAVERATRKLHRICVSPTGEQASSVACNAGSISTNGRYVVFDSTATNLVAGHTGSTRDVYVRDLRTRTTSLVSVNTAGEPANANSSVSSGDNYSGGRHISADGRWVVFSSSASNLASGDEGNSVDTFVRDRVAGVTLRVSPPGITTTTIGDDTAISDDGQIVAFVSRAKRHDDDSTGGNLFVVNLVTRVVLRLAMDEKGDAAGGHQPALSADGLVVGFASFGSQMSSDDVGGADEDVFIRTLPEGFR